jgi:hypothetical protein
MHMHAADGGCRCRVVISQGARSSSIPP